MTTGNPPISAGRTGAARLRFWVLVAVIALAPAALLRTVFSKAPFDGSLAAELRAAAPDYVFIGDSMLETRLDVAEFERLTGKKAFLIAENGSASARWWLAFKNQLVASGVRPRRVFLFYRDRQWSWPEYRTEARYRELLEAASLDVEPEMDLVLGTVRSGFRARVHAALDRVYPIRRGQGEALDRIDQQALDWAPGFRGDMSGTRLAIENTFDLKALRKDVGAEMATDDGPQSDAFDPDPTASFLPHFVALARAQGIPLHLVRVKRRPNRPGDVRYQKADLMAYAASLERWASENGVGHHDFTPDPAITLSMYADGDHIAAGARAGWTRHFVGAMGDALR
jgi:hypothetical protein